VRCRPSSRKKKRLLRRDLRHRGPHRGLSHLGQRGRACFQAIMEGLPARDDAPGRRLLVQRPVHLRRGGAAPPGTWSFAVPIFHAGTPGSRSPPTFRPLPGHRGAGARARSRRNAHRDLPRGRPRAAGAHSSAEGQLNEEAYRIFLRNSRLPDLVGGRHPGDDGFGAAWPRPALGELWRPLRGSRRCWPAFDECIAQTATRARELFLELIPSGQWRFHDFLDSDGGPRGAAALPDRPSRLPRVRADHVRLDGSLSGRPGRGGPINFTTKRGGCFRIAFRALSAIPRPRTWRVNEGLLANLDEWIAREGPACSSRASRPRSAMRANTRFPGHVLHLRHPGPGQRAGRVARGARRSTCSTTSGPWDAGGGKRPILCIEGLGVRAGGARPLRRRGRRHLLHRAGELPGPSTWERDFPPAGGALRGCGRTPVGPGCIAAATGSGARRAGCWPSAAEGWPTRMENTVVGALRRRGAAARGRTGRIVLNPDTPGGRRGAAGPGRRPSCSSAATCSASRTCGGGGWGRPARPASRRRGASGRGRAVSSHARGARETTMGWWVDEATLEVDKTATQEERGLAAPRGPPRSSTAVPASRQAEERCGGAFRAADA